MIKKYADARGVKAYKLRDYKTIKIDDEGVLFLLIYWRVHL